jgi:uncharacterized protein DUF397
VTDLAGATWSKSSRSNGQGGNCVEVARDLPGAVAVRDSKDPAGPVVVLTPAAWSAFLTRLRGGGYDGPDRGA